MKRPALLALAIVPLVGIFIAARSAASWRPQTLTEAEFQEHLTSSPTYVDLDADDASENSLLTPAQKQVKQRAIAKDWQARAISPDGKMLLAQNKAWTEVAVCRASDVSLVAKLQTQRTGEMSAGQFSPDGQLVAFSRFEVSPTRVFDAQTGQFLWQGEYWGELFAFSPDGKLAAHTTANEDFILVRDSVTGRELKRVAAGWTQPYFSRDSNYLLAQTSTGIYQQLRLR